MPGQMSQCRYCGATIPSGATVYGDHNRRFCSEACAISQLDHEQGVSGHPSRAGGERVIRDGDPTQRPGGDGPTSR